MPIKLKCRCGEKLSAPDSAAGKKGKCPKCGMQFVVPQTLAATEKPSRSESASSRPRPTPPPPAPDLDGLPDLDDEIGLMEEPVAPTPAATPAPSFVEVKRKAEAVRALRASLERFGMGVSLVLWGTLGAILSFVILPLFAYVHFLGGPLPSYRLGVVVKFALVVSWGLSIAGHSTCLWTSRHAGAKGLLLLALGTDIAAMVMAVLGLTRVVGTWPMFAVSGICLFIGSIAFAQVLRGIVPIIKRDDLARDIKISMIALGICVVASAISFGVPPLGALIFLLVGPWGLYKYLSLLQQIVGALRG